MKSTIHIALSASLAVAALLSASVSLAQQKTQLAGQSSASLQSYDTKRETAVLGTVVQYTAASSAAPFGAHLTLQTVSGLVDVHLGNSRFLEANHFSLATGDTVRIIGETVATGQSTTFLARVVQKGMQALAVRSERGIPLSYAAPRSTSSSAVKSQGGAL